MLTSFSLFTLLLSFILAKKGVPQSCSVLDQPYASKLGDATNKSNRAADEAAVTSLMVAATPVAPYLLSPSLLTQALEGYAQPLFPLVRSNTLTAGRGTVRKGEVLAGDSKQAN
eukprot:CAMPEP_0113884890 /NCGR_PEP_ID=MMETSP0780_2-20120614/10554_1 /TAXON_ID=652834 /ORGANISM="Palpitomonas bilix" /LENGTH=113 /DNA_ID=CAMNT_0000872651 /DNA_START=366 /DNA_END=703 /DNA_ORIENTATION=- /assembly_acc=CAM_ASM_000599